MSARCHSHQAWLSLPVPYPGEDSGRFGSVEDRVFGLAGLAGKARAAKADPIVFLYAMSLDKSQ